MKRIKLYFLSLIFILYVTSFTYVDVFANSIVEIDSVPIQGTNSEITKQPLTNKPIELSGPSAESNFYYELFSDLESNDYYVQFDITNSELLIEPSSLTIKIDGEPVHTVSLAGENSHNVRVKLEGTALNEGIHTITASFSGYVMEGVCVFQNSTGNWMTIQANSFLNIETELNEDSAISLEDYPRSYIGSLEHQVDVIIPKSPSNETMQSAHIIASYLSSQSMEDTISVVNEDEVEAINGNIVIVGATEEFETSWMNQTLNSEENEINKDSLYLSQLQIKYEQHSVNALVVLANHSKDILKNIRLLTTNQYVEQITGETLQIKDLPTLIEEQPNDNEVTLSDLGMADLMLDNFNTRTQTYYYYLPANKHDIENPSIELYLKRSDLIKNSKEIHANKTETEVDGKVELIVTINGVPHSVDIQALEEDADGNAKVNIPFDKEILQDNQLVTFQMEANGLRTENPCLSTEKSKWIYIFDDSKLILPTQSNSDVYDMNFNSFPFPFSDRNDELFIVLPNEEISNEDMQNLFNVLSINNSLPTIHLVSSSEITEEQLEKGHIIFIGSINEHKLLKSMVEDLIVNYDESVPRLSDHGFLQSEAKFYGFMQKNPWEENYYMAVLDNLDENNQYFSNELLAYLQFLENNASIVVQSGPDKFFTNAVQLQTVEGNNLNKDETKRSSVLLNWSIGFFVLISVLIILIIVYYRRKKLERNNQHWKETVSK
ncbi:cellulose biosynthesis cyclic di-GMP-binding regulatory protein BcsB [Ornithinibacillus salinisoli]|uniref:Cellulose biosynthesis cyclic di-GMP-binding regulatory protein BcsB n=1 Tax=Ornithinibacillus salinisoli TaxID=1848459 RepID=A0ABW4VYI1_9BACI